MIRSFVVLCVMIFNVAGPLLARAASVLPNVVLVLADDLGYGDPRCYNPDSRIPTPRIDALAREGMRFTDAHTPSSVCSPTRYGLLTGRYCWRTRLKSGVLNGYSPALIEPGRMTVASLLKQRGYYTACIGKWHLGLGDREPADFSGPLSPGPNAVGFDETFVLPASLDMPPYVFVENERAAGLPSEQIAASEPQRRGGKGFWRAGAMAPGFRHIDTLPSIAQQAVKFVKGQTSKKPFFLYLPLTGPHTPWMPRDEFRGRSQAGSYGDFVAQVDATLGDVLDALERGQLADNTIVIFTSDNGARWLPSDIEQWNHRANANWRGQKADIWEAGHRVPLVIRWPRGVAAGGQSAALVSLTDVLATLAEIVGEQLPPTAGEDSISFAGTLLGNDAADRPGRSTIVHHSGDGTFAIRRGSWKLVSKLGSHGFSEPTEVAPEPGGPTGQLYHLGEDSRERDNRWLREPQVVRELSDLLTACQQQGQTRTQAE